MNFGAMSHGYRIGAAAALSGLPINTIRNWEKRYQVVTPTRTVAGDRRYCEQDIEKLMLLRQLTERGISIRDIAPLSNRELEQRLSRMTKSLATRAAIIGCMDESMLARLSRGGGKTWQVCGPLSEAELEGFSGDVLLLELDALGGDPIRRVEQIQASTHATLFVIYEFTTQACLARLGELGVWLYRRPMYEVFNIARVIQLTQPPQNAQASPQNDVLAGAPPTH